MHTTVIELDALTDAVRPTAQDHYFFALGRARLALFVIARIHIRRAGGEFGRAGIDALVYRTNAMGMALGADIALFYLEQMRQAAIGKSFALERTQFGSVDLRQRFLLDVEFKIDQLLDLREEPHIDLGIGVNLFKRHADTERIGYIPEALAARIGKFVADFFRIHRFQVEAVNAGLQATQRFLQGLLEIATDGHHFANAFHLRG